MFWRQAITYLSYYVITAYNLDNNKQINKNNNLLALTGVSIGLTAHAVYPNSSLPLLKAVSANNPAHYSL